jgi:hypothetical protein
MGNALSGFKIVAEVTKLIGTFEVESVYSSLGGIFFYFIQHFSIGGDTSEDLFSLALGNHQVRKTGSCSR